MSGYTVDVAALCHWTDRDGLTHQAFHHGDVCPFFTVAEVLAGHGDPRDLVAEWRVDISHTLKPNGSVPLSLNDSSSNPFAVANARDKIKARVRNAVRDAEVPVLDYVHVELHYQPKTNAHRDPDNLVATLKPAIDALHQADKASKWAGILTDDDPRYLSWSPPFIHRAVKGEAPRLWLLLRSFDSADSRAPAASPALSDPSPGTRTYPAPGFGSQSRGGVA